MKNEILEKLFENEIKWTKIANSIRYFYCYFEDELYLLRINNFPDEPYLTFINKQQIIDLEELPKKWVVPY